jgi:hypothetical protein
LLAPAADFGADPTVLVMRGVPAALLGTGATCRCARLDRCSDDAEIRFGLPGHNATSRVAEVCAVKAEANAADELHDVLLAEARIGAARASRGTVEALVDTAEHQIAIEAGRSGMLLDHLSSCHVVSSSRDKARRRAAARLLLSGSNLVVALLAADL